MQLPAMSKNLEGDCQGKRRNLPRDDQTAS
jgi:hypothetical protein